MPLLDITLWEVLVVAAIVVLVIVALYMLRRM